MALRSALMFLFLGTSSGIDYCKMNCTSNGGNKHVLCNEEEDKKTCNAKLNVKPKRELLELHNEFRQNVSGVNGALPGAHPIGDLSWDDYLHQTAAAVGLSCLRRVNDCRSNDEFKEVGQSWEDQPISHPGADKATIELIDAAKQMLIGWTQRILEEPKAPVIMKKYSDGPWRSGTQILWAKTMKVGCAAILFARNSNEWHRTLICHYWPAGNILDEEVYEVIEGTTLSPSTSVARSSTSVARSSKSLFLPSTFTDPSSYPKPDPTIGIIIGDLSVEENRSLPLQKPTLVPVVDVIISDASPTFSRSHFALFSLIYFVLS